MPKPLFSKMTIYMVPSQYTIAKMKLIYSAFCIKYKDILKMVFHNLIQSEYDINVEIYVNSVCSNRVLYSNK